MGNWTQRFRSIRFHSDEQGLCKLVWRHACDVQSDEGCIVEFYDELIKDVPLTHVVILNLSAEDVFGVALARDHISVNEVTLESKCDQLLLVLFRLFFLLNNLFTILIKLLRLLLVALSTLPLTVYSSMLWCNKKISSSFLDFVILTVQFNNVCELVRSRKDILVDKSRAPLLVRLILRIG